MPLGTSSILADLTFNAGLRVAFANPPDMAEMMAWKTMLTPGEVFVDVGANVGVYTIWVAQLGVDVIAFEPGPAAFDRLKQNVALNGFTVDCRQAAVGAEVGRLRLTEGKDTLNRLVLDLEAADDSTLWVDVTTLDVVVGDGTVAGVKIDVEGAEELVVQGGAQSLADGRIGALQLEWNALSHRMLGHDRQPIWDLLQAFRYDLVRPDDRGVLHRVDGPELGKDLFAVHR